MEQAARVAGYLSNALFILLAVQAARLWRRHQSTASAWMAATFATLGMIAAIGLVLPEDGELPLLATKALVLGILAIPALLYQFARSLDPTPQWLDRVAAAGVAVVAVATLALPSLPGEGESPTAVEGAFIVAFVAVWMFLLVTVGVRFLAAGRDRSVLPRRRMWLLGAAAVLLGLVLAASAVPSDAPGLDLATSVVTSLTAALFLIGFRPPPMLVDLWRRAEERELYDVAVAAVGTIEEPEVLFRKVLPRVAEVAGADRVSAINGGRRLGHHPADTPPLGPEDVPSRDVTRAAVGELELLVEVGPYAPLFGDDENRNLERIALLLELALQRARAFAESREARAELEATNAELEAFVYSASHDLKTPVIALLGYLELLADEYGEELDETAMFYLERMQVNGRFMRDLIHDLLQLSRIGRVDVAPEDVDIGETVGRVAPEIRDRHPGMTIEVGTLPVIEATRTRMHQLFANLLDNAGIHGGHDDLHVTVSASPLADGGVAVTVADDGVGVPEEYRERILGVFERLDGDSTEGTGIGLAICRKIMESLGGSIRVKAARSRSRRPGAAFVLEFPAGSVRSTALDAEAGPPPPDAAPPRDAEPPPDPSPPPTDREPMP